MREYVDICCTDDRYSGEALREVRRLHSVAKEREGSILVLHLHLKHTLAQPITLNTVSHMIGGVNISGSCRLRRLGLAMRRRGAARFCQRSNAGHARSD